MAQHISAQKRIRQTVKKTAVNRSRLSRIRNLMKSVENSITAGDSKAARAALLNLQPEIMRGVTKGVMHKNTASRKMSRLSGRVKSLSAA